MNKSFILITLTNSGYKNYTLNFIKSLEKIGYKNDFKCYCLDDDSLAFLKSRDVEVERIMTKEDLSKFEDFSTDLFNKITLYKLGIIHQNLLKYDYVIFADGDIVFEDSKFVDYLFDNINGFDMLCQQNYKGRNVQQKEVICSGFLFIRSNARTVNMFKPSNVKKYDSSNDQEYINEAIGGVKYKLLPVQSFPNGTFYYRHSEKLSPLLIHFNCVIGDYKNLAMKKYNKWYIK